MSEDPPAPFDTETMAEVWARQGRSAEAAAIYRRLAARAGEDGDPETRARRERRIAELEQGAPAAGPGPAAEIPVPGLAVVRTGDEVAVQWAVSEETAAALEVVLITRGSGGVETSRRRVPLAAATGRMTLEAPGLHSAAVALGLVEADGRFVLLAHQRAL